MPSAWLTGNAPVKGRKVSVAREVWDYLAYLGWGENLNGEYMSCRRTRAASISGFFHICSTQRRPGTLPLIPPSEWDYY
jgi:hypothetical protein